MNGKKIIYIVAAIFIVDQLSKFYIKLNFHLGEEIWVFGLSWFRIHFVENDGMAWGWSVGGKIGKIALTIFRLIAVIYGVFFIKKLIKEKYSNLLLFCAALIYAGALGNLFDSLFYGIIFNESNPYTQNLAQLFPKNGGYAPFLFGKVVDMLYFPIIKNGHFPQWLPIWGGEDFEFFSLVFNISDSVISIAMFIMIIFQNKIFLKQTT